jgi:hypothetical protein
MRNDISAPPLEKESKVKGSFEDISHHFLVDFLIIKESLPPTNLYLSLQVSKSLNVELFHSVLWKWVLPIENICQKLKKSVYMTLSEFVFHNNKQQHLFTKY